MYHSKGVVLAASILFSVVGVQASVVVDTVPVGHPGNTGELSGEGAGGFGPNRFCGAVDYEFGIGKFETTAAQYTEFLNAVADADSYDLYNTRMWTDNNGCRIERSGTPGSYTYSVAADWANRPVNYVSWGDAARFTNWLHNGQPTGAQDVTTTEDGSYFLNGVITTAELVAVTREADAVWVIPSEDEWYKSAYHKNGLLTTYPWDYWDYATGTNYMPSNDLVDPDPGNNATYYIHAADYTIGNPYFRTEIGAHENSVSPYGTFDQSGNVYEWNEAVIDDSRRGTRGGSYVHGGLGMHAASRHSRDVTGEYGFVGFRVANVPEPGALTLLLFGALAALPRR